MSEPLLKPVTLEPGERYGKLTVLEPVKTKHGLRYRVGCTCGHSGLLVRTNDLLKGRRTACLKCSGT
jgi:predicted SprT family Zn-dependent metalloprotease